VAHNTFENALKKKWREAVLPFDFDLILPHAVATETADEGTRRDDDRRLLDQCLSELDAKYREPLVLYYYEELDYTEIAEVLHIPLSTLGVRLRRARARMKELVSKKDPHYEQ
jgi:RNA polymerase sigma-70 factor (ECF subfamily)